MGSLKQATTLTIEEHMKTIDMFNKLADLLSAEEGRDCLIKNSSFRKKFSALQALLSGCDDINSIPKEACGLAETLCNMIQKKGMSIPAYMKLKKQKDNLKNDYPYLTSLLQEISLSSQKEVDLIISTLMG